MTTINSVGKVNKGWGYEDIWVSTPYYCSKFLHFNKDAMFSMHFHKVKIETWYCMSGKFIVQYIDTETAEVSQRMLTVGDTWHNNTLEPHRIICVEEGVILEVSTPDNPKDNYRILPGDSQKRK